MKHPALLRSNKTAENRFREPPLVEVVVGGTASLPCNVTLEDDEATLILWYRSDLPNPIYTLDVRNASLRNAKRFPSSEIGNRTNFDIATQPPTLLLSNITVNDAKDYRCRVDLRRSRTLILHSRLRVIGESTFLFELFAAPGLIQGSNVGFAANARYAPDEGGVKES
ncbi:ig-like domain-containing protein [Trichonephila clavipes]|uniref:Ig-like domain-containing protein n=1 Tax=Trichonephila clavipes TaxID=2585209 RepID=A0A8X6WBL3_TRICX|nr:ig-like domain-containing protein [Trichonephila clavipes]